MKTRVLRFLPLLLIFALYLAFAGYRLRWLPAEWYGDITIEHREVTAILTESWPWRFNESAGPAYHYIVAGFAKVLGRSFLTYKIASLVTGLVIVWMVYLLGKELAGRRVGLLAALAAAVSTWLIIFARLGSSPQILTPVLSAGAVLFLVRFSRSQDWLDIVLSMCFAGMGLFTYPATFVLPLVIIALIGWQIIFARQGSAPAEPNHSNRRWWAALLLALVLMAPFTLWFLRLAETTPAFKPGGYVGTKLVGNDEPPVEIARAFGRNMLTALGMFHWTGDKAFRTNVSGTPVLDPLSGALMILGLGWLFLNPRLRPCWAYLLVPIIILLAPSANPGVPPIEVPSASRAFAAAPFVFILVGLGLNAAWIFASRLVASREILFGEARRQVQGPTLRARLAGLQNWIAALDEAGPLALHCHGETARCGESARRVYLIAVLVLFALAAGITSLNVNRYFNAYAWGLPQHNQPWAYQIARQVDAQPAGTVVKMGACCWAAWKVPDPESIFYVLELPEGREYLLKDPYVKECSQLAPGVSYLLIFPPKPGSDLVTRFTGCFPAAHGEMHYDALGQEAFYTLKITP